MFTSHTIQSWFIKISILLLHQMLQTLGVAMMYSVRNGEPLSDQILNANAITYLACTFLCFVATMRFFETMVKHSQTNIQRGLILQ